MSTELLPCTYPHVFSRIRHTLDTGGLIAFPTDTVYGLAAPAFNAQSIERLFQAKGRDSNKAIAVLIGDLEQLGLVAMDLPPAARKLAEHFWPGALTLVVRRNPRLPENLSPLPTIGVRMPDHSFARELLRRSGPLATTSANLSGGPNPLTAQDVLAQLCGRIEMILDGGATPGGVPSTVVDCTQPELTILRQGAISAEALQAALDS